MAKKAKVLLEWNRSISTDVVSQVLQITLMGNQEPLVNTELPASVEEFTVDVPEKNLVHVEIRAFDGINYSAATALDFEIEDLTSPEPITGLTYSILEVFTEEEPTQPPPGPLPVPLGLGK